MSDKESIPIKGPTEEIGDAIAKTLAALEQMSADEQAMYRDETIQEHWQDVADQTDITFQQFIDHLEAEEERQKQELLTRQEMSIEAKWWEENYGGIIKGLETMVEHTKIFLTRNGLVNVENLAGKKEAEQEPSYQEQIEAFLSRQGAPAVTPAVAKALTRPSYTPLEGVENVTPQINEPVEPEATVPESVKPEVTPPEIDEPEITPPEVVEAPAQKDEAAPEIDEPEITPPEVVEAPAQKDEAAAPDVPEELTPAPLIAQSLDVVQDTTVLSDVEIAPEEIQLVSHGTVIDNAHIEAVQALHDDVSAALGGATIAAFYDVPMIQRNEENVTISFTHREGDVHGMVAVKYGADGVMQISPNIYKGEQVVFTKEETLEVSQDKANETMLGALAENMVTAQESIVAMQAFREAQVTSARDDGTITVDDDFGVITIPGGYGETVPENSETPILNGVTTGEAVDNNQKLTKQIDSETSVKGL